MGGILILQQIARKEQHMYLAALFFVKVGHIVCVKK
jgi:hypothetical protein